ncbi:MAG TPA: Sbal_3080 family lipoprotein [Burkholderiales bacterium]|nr:Sbal_3080 family lipoprotein [Burkholderiales bacterium]
MRRNIAFACTLALVLCACTISKQVKPITATDVREICIKRNPAVIMEQFLPEIAKQIEAHGVKTRTYIDTKPDDCRYTLDYVANWQWDMAMYLKYADLIVRDGSELIGRVTYDARGGGGNMSKFGTTAEKIRPLIDELFAQVKPAQ